MKYFNKIEFQNLNLKMPINTTLRKLLQLVMSVLDGKKMFYYYNIISLIVCHLSNKFKRFFSCYLSQRKFPTTKQK